MSGPPNVRMNVHKRVLDARSHSRPGGHVTNPSRPLLLEHIQHEFFIANITPINRQAVTGTKLAKTSQIGLLDPNVVIVVHLVHDHDGIAPLQEELRDIATDESRSSGDEDLLVPRVRGEDGAAIVGEIGEAVGRFDVAGRARRSRRSVVVVGAGLVEMGQAGEAFSVAEFHFGIFLVNLLIESVSGRF